MLAKLFSLFKSKDVVTINSHGYDINSFPEHLDTCENAILIDVRSDAEFAEGHIPSAVHVPMQVLLSDPSAFIDNLDQIVFLYCHSGKRSGMVKDQLKDEGYTKAYNLGGILDYNKTLVK